MSLEGLFDPDALLGEAERLVARVPAGMEAEVYLERSAGLDLDIEKGAVGSSGLGVSAGGSWRVVAEGRLGFAYFTELADAQAAFERAVRHSRHAPAKGYRLPEAAPPAALPGRWDPEVAAFDVAAALGLARSLIEAAAQALPQATVSGGGIGLEAGCIAIASTRGVACSDRETGASAGASLVLEQGERSISANDSDTAHRLAALDAAGAGRRAAETVASLREPGLPGPSGPADVILRPEAVAELVCALAVDAATGDEAMRGKTVWSGRLGQEVADRRFTLADDPTEAGAVGAVPFDDEGVPARRVPIVEEGRLRSFLFDSWDGHQHGMASTGSAVRSGFKGRPATGSHHLVLPGPARPLEALVAGVDHGYLVESVLGAHTANATTGEFSVTAPNVWRIVGGAVAGPCSEVAIAGRLEDLLQRLAGASSERRRMDGATLPWLAFRGLDVSA
jgi:PmbA protein